MSNWKDKTDFEINVAVVETQGLKACNEQYLDYGDRDDRVVILSDLRVVDYCNNPSDAWPIIVENKISIINYGDEWEASIDFEQDTGKFGTSETWTKSISDKNALRAAMIVYLEMNGVKP